MKPTIDSYIAAQPEDVQELLQAIRETIHCAAPLAEERISWGMPTFWQGEYLIHFAAFKKHISIFPGSEAVAAFAESLQGYRSNKGTIQLPLSRPIPYELISQIVTWKLWQITSAKVQ